MDLSHPSPPPSILIAEDTDSIRLNLQEVFSAPPQEYSDAYGIPRFHVETAATGTEAEIKLLSALRRWKPYDVISLDLGLPKKAGDNPAPSVGLKILNDLSDGPLKGAGSAVVIQTVHTDLPTFLDTLRANVADFVPKPCGTEDFFRSVTLVYKKTRQEQKTKWEEYKLRRDNQWVLVQACAQVADSMARIVSEGLGEILSHTRELGDLLEEQLMLDPVQDSDHPICRGLERIRETAATTVHQCAASRTAAMPVPSPIEKIDLSRQLEGVLNRLRFGFAYRHLEVSVEGEDGVSVRASGSDLDLLLEEMLFGAMEASEAEQRITIKIIREPEAGSALVEVRDHGPLIQLWDGERLAKNHELDEAGERGWRLSLAERVALNVGGRLEVRASEGGNRVILALSEAF